LSIDPTSSKLAVAIIRARYNPYGGAERFVQRALTALAQEQVALTVIARDWQSSPVGESLANVRLHKIDPFYIGRIWRDASFAQAVTAYLQNGGFDLVQSHERIPGVQIYRAGDGVHAEYLQQRLNVANRVGRIALRINPFHWFTCRAEALLFEHLDLEAVICNSTMVRDEILARFRISPAKLHLVRNGVDLDKFQPPSTEQRVKARSDLGLPPDAPVFAFVGSGFERKGVANAIRALAEKAAPPHAWLVVVGDDRKGKRYRRLADDYGVGDRVLFTGSLVDVRPVLQAADGFVLPTLYDPFPNAVLEALACGLPVVTSPKCGAAELIEPGKNGFICNAVDAPAIAQRLAEIARSPEMRLAARASAAPYSLKFLAGQLLTLYRTMVAGKAA
jgi:UDP-glucose:(heptosyl)LPS alpha-1,3-glucosyltransferase